MPHSPCFFLSLTVLQVIGYVFPILTFPYLTRVIGVYYFGAISFAMAITLYFQTVVDWGFNLTSARNIAQNRDNREAVSHIFSVTIYSKLLLIVPCILLLFILTLTIDVFREKWLILWLAFLTVPGHIFFPEWFFQGLERMKYITILNFVVKSVFTALVFLLITSPEDYVLQPMLSSLGFLIAGIVSTVIILYRWGYRFVHVPLSECIAEIRSAFDVFVNIMIPNLYNAFSVLILGFWGGDKANGILEGGYKFVTICGNFLQIISRTFFPYLARRGDKFGVYARLNLGAALVASLVMFIFAPQIIDIFLTVQFDESVTVLRILAPSIFFISLSTTFGSNYLILRHKEKLSRNVSVVSSLTGFVCSWFLVYHFGWLGAALSIFIGRAPMGLGLFVFAVFFKRTYSRMC